MPDVGVESDQAPCQVREPTRAAKEELGSSWDDMQNPHVHSTIFPSKSTTLGDP
jgi:hypothetical protein